jgi:hypothetical protein
MKKRLTNLIILATVVTFTISAEAQVQSKAEEASVAVTAKNFPRAETHQVMKTYVDLGAFGRFWHHRRLVSLDQQNVVRMNRDTLYSGLILDLTKPATITKPDTKGRYQSMLVINEDHFAKKVFYKPGKYVLTRDDIGTRYAAVVVRTLVDAEDPDDLAQVHALQDLLKVEQADIGDFEIPKWDSVSLNRVREALKVLGEGIEDRSKSYGPGPEAVDAIAHLVGSADAWGGWLPENAAYLGFIPEQNDGNTPYVLTLKDVPYEKGAFWSVTVYNSDGYLVKNKPGKYVVNSQKATYNADGSATIHFGGNPEQQNFLPIIDNWNYWIRVYLPQKAYFDGSWKAPEAQPAT